MDWTECNERRFVKKINSDENLVKSLVSSSRKRFESSERLNLDETTAASKVSLVYDSLRELLEALAIKKGFKIYNHECFSCFLYEICHEKLFSDEFDRFRKIRNQISYYGKDLPLNEAKAIILDILKLRRDLIKKYF
jgi:hypothetical protein